MARSNSTKAPSFAALVQTFFAEHLQQRAVSPCTVAAYRDAFVLFLDFAQTRLRKQPTEIALNEVTPALILAFLDHLERKRGNAVRSRNARLAAIRAFLKFASRRDVSALHAVEKAMGVPMKRFERPMLGYLSREEMLAIIRHTTAMHLLQSGVDISVIALWLGHESPTTTHQYVEADLMMKEQALGKLQEPDAAVRRYKAPDSLIEFLKTL